MDFIEIIPVKGGNLPSDFMFYKNEEAISVQRYLVFRVGCSFMEIIRKCIVVGIFPIRGTLSFQYGIFHPDFIVNVGLLDHLNWALHAVDTRVLMECFSTFLIDV